MDDCPHPRRQRAHDHGRDSPRGQWIEAEGLRGEVCRERIQGDEQSRQKGADAKAQPVVAVLVVRASPAPGLELRLRRPFVQAPAVALG